jgi:hypothetical protein
MDFEAVLNNISYIEDLQKVDKEFLSDQTFIEQVLHKFGRSEDFSPDQIIDFVSVELKDNPQFILSTFLKVISLGYTKNYLYSNHQETISYFFENHVSRLLKDEEFCLKLVKGYCGTSLLNDPGFLKDVQENNEMEWGDIDAENKENLKEFLIRKTISDTTFKKTDSFLILIDLAGWNVLKYLPDHFKYNEEIYVYALKKNIKAKEFIPAELQEKSEVIKSILNDKNSAKDKRAKTKAFAELLLSDPEKFTEETQGMKFAIDLKKLKELPDKVAEALGKHNGNVNLSGISELSENTATHLKNHTGTLSLCGLQFMDEGVAETLMMHKGNIDLRSNFHHSYYDYEELSLALAKLIVKNEKDNRIRFRKLKKLSPEVAEVFNSHSLTLHGLTSLSDETAEVLSRGTGKELEMNDLLELTDESARCLGQFKGSYELSLKGLESLTAQAARNLSQYKGIHLRLSGLKIPSMDVIQSLCTFHGNLCLEGIESIPVSGIEHFCQTIDKSRTNEGRKFSVVLHENVFQNGTYEDLLTKYSITKERKYEYKIGYVFVLK